MEYYLAIKKEMDPHHKLAGSVDLRQAFSFFMKNMPTNAFLVVGQELVC